MTRRRVEVVSRYRDEDGVVRDHPIRLLVGEDVLDVAERVPSHSEIIGSMRSRELAGDWIPLGHVPRELLPEDDYGPEEWEPDPGDTRTRYRP